MKKLLNFTFFADFPHLEKINPYQESGTKYHIFCLDSCGFSKADATGPFAYLLVPDNNSIFANQVKNFINEGEKVQNWFSIPFEHLKFKTGLFPQKASIAGNGLLVKDTSQVNFIGTSEPATSEATFKVVKSIKSGLDRETLVPNYTDVKVGEPYAYVLEIEPLDLGIEGMLPLTRIVFYLYIHVGIGNDGERKTSMKNFREKYEKIIASATGKELAVEIKKWSFSKRNGGYNTLEFREDDEFGKIEEKGSQDDNKPSDNQDNQTITQIQTSTKQAITKLLTESNLKTSDLDSKFANWEADLNKLDTKTKIQEFQQELEQAIKDKQQKSGSNKNNGLSLSAKIAIGGGIVVVILGLVGVIWFRRKKQSKNKNIIK